MAVQNLTYIFVLAVGVAAGFAGFFGLQLTVIEAALLGLSVFLFCAFLVERTLRRIAHARLERSVQDLSRLLSTNAQAGQALAKRVSALEDQEGSSRLEVLEADISVLGTVVRQVAETVSDIEDAQGHLTTTNVEKPNEPAAPARAEPDALEPVIPIEMLRQAMNEGRLLYYVQPIVTLPQKQPFGYDIVPHLLLEDGEVAGPEDFMPLSGHGDIMRDIEDGAMQLAIGFSRRSRTAGLPSQIFVPMTSASLANAAFVNQLAAKLEANKAVISDIQMTVSEENWKSLTTVDGKNLELLAQKGAQFSLRDLESLRLGYANLAEYGVKSVRAVANRLVENPESYTDLHAADLAPFLGRFEIDLIVTDVSSEQHILTCIDDGISYATGPHIAGAGPIREDLAAGAASSSKSTARIANS